MKILFVHRSEDLRQRFETHFSGNEAFYFTSKNAESSLLESDFYGFCHLIIEEGVLKTEVVDKLNSEEDIKVLWTRVSDSNSAVEFEGLLKISQQILFWLGQANSILNSAKKNPAEHVFNHPQFITHLSHEIRSPLNLILGTTEALYDSQLSAHQKSLVECLMQSGDQLLKLTNDILDFSKYESGQACLNPKPYKLRQEIEKIATLTRENCDQKGIEFRVKYSDLPEQVIVDGNKFYQVIINLVNNAIKFTLEGHIELRFSTVNEAILFEVSDSGIGIRKEDLPHIFEEFFNLDTFSHCGHFKGTGLGLPIVRKIIELMGGEVGVVSEFRKGTTFSLRVPFKEYSFAEEKETNLSKRLPAESLKILLADDCDESHFLLRAFLQDTGHSIDCVANGAEAVKAALECDYDLVLMDIQMPEKDGFEASNEIRLGEKSLGKKEVPIVALTADALEDQASDARQNGFNGYVTKPLSKATLLIVIDELISPSNLYREIEAGRRDIFFLMLNKYA